MEEVLVGFGSASYNAQGLERKLVILVASVFTARNLPVADGDFDNAMERFTVSTLGVLIRKLCEVLKLPASLEDRLRDALSTRNYLVHRFFWKHAEDELSSAGRRKMLLELSQLSGLLYELTGEVEAMTDAFVCAYLSESVRAQELPPDLADVVYRLYQQSIASEFTLMQQIAEEGDEPKGN
jgi:hypothetical protein